MPKKNGSKDRRPTRSGAVGGPGTGSGLSFQVDFATRQALEAISQALADPIEDFRISMEPRVVTGKSTVTCWDVRLSHPERVTEVKLRPNRADIEEWLDRVDLGVRQKRDLEFELAYGRGASSLLTAIESLCRIAKEADGSPDKFQALVALEQSETIEAVLGRLTAEPHASLLRVHVRPIDPESLEQEIDFRLRYMVCARDRTRLHEFLVAKFHKGIKQRATYRVRDLIQEGRDAQIEFFAPPPSLPRHIPPIVSHAICILQYCEAALPTEVLAAGIDCTREEVDEALTQYLGAVGLTEDNGCWKVGEIRPSVVQDNGLRLVGKALCQLLEFIGVHRRSALGRRQVPNAIALAKVCQFEDSELVSTLFWKLDKLLKRTGNKRLVLEVANLSLAAAGRPPQTEAKTKGEAVALICGRAWVYQRINRLAKARADGERSRQIGEAIEWFRNTAFCQKCLGRLFRMEAEQQREDEAKFRELLGSSMERLEQATASFQRVTELSASERSAEVGDCQSLLGRAHFVAGDLVKAKVAAREAVRRITDVTSKDYADLQILLGDLANAEHDSDAAVNYYDKAISSADTSDPEKSEIAARAWFRKGEVVESTRSFDRAAEIWAKLDEEEMADEARWQSMLLSRRVPPGAQRALEGESASVRVEAIGLYEEAVEEMGSYRGQRSEPGEGYWSELLPDARKNVAVRHVEW